MNERIQKLAEQAGFNLHNDPIDGHDNTHEIKKFAELIVRECIDVGIKDFYNHLPNIFPANAIKKHFGVEQ
jgi:hypothetical protein